MTNAKESCPKSTLDKRAHLYQIDSDRIGKCKFCGEVKDFRKAQIEAGLKDNNYNYYTRDVPFDILPHNFYKGYNREPSLTNRRPLGKYD